MEGVRKERQCEKVSIEICAINGFSIDFIRALDLYMNLDVFCKYDDWLKRVTINRTMAKDFFYVYSEQGMECLFTLKTAKEVAMNESTSNSDALVECLQRHEKEARKNISGNVLLSDADKSALVQDFATSIGWEEKPIVMPADTLIAMVDTIQLCKMQIDQIQAQLSRCDFSNVNLRESS